MMLDLHFSLLPNNLLCLPHPWRWSLWARSGSCPGTLVGGGAGGVLVTGLGFGPNSRLRAAGGSCRVRSRDRPNVLLSNLVLRGRWVLHWRGCHSCRLRCLYVDCDVYGMPFLTIFHMCLTYHALCYLPHYSFVFWAEDKCVCSNVVWHLCFFTNKAWLL